MLDSCDKNKFLIMFALYKKYNYWKDICEVL